DRQDSETWSHEYDTNSYIGYEALRQHAKFGASLTPYATGDAIDGGWGETNLVLYGSSHVGIFGSIIDTTNIEGILKLDLLKTDFFRDDAYPTFLIYNPFDVNKTVEINVGLQNANIYETTTNNFLINGVSGNVEITIPSKTAYVIVQSPSSGIIKYDYEKLLIDDVIVDYSSGQSVVNYPPRIKSLAALNQTILKGDSINIYCTAVDKNDDEINYTWSSLSGEIVGAGEQVLWIAPGEPGIYNINVEINDGSESKASEQIQIEVIEEFNSAPRINKLTADPRKIDLGGQTEILCSAVDDENDNINYSWNSVYGLIQGSGENIIWTAPNEPGNYSIVCTVADAKGESNTDSIIVSVRDLSIMQSGNLICYLPFNGNADDASGNNNITVVSGAALSTDRFEASGSAYQFDGANDNIKITNSALLNFANSITINLWINIAKLYDREQYPISHGNWEKRWKISISNNKIRWTIKTGSGIVDLDSETIVEFNKWYNVTA
ncbi:MAG: LamG domain-containing protein, partial [Melioribacteraceae bacterium]